MTVGRVKNFSHHRAGKAQGKGMPRYAEGGMARHDDAAQDRKMINAAMKKEEASDKRMIKRAVAEHETQEHGGKHSKIKLAQGGAVGMSSNQDTKDWHDRVLMNGPRAVVRDADKNMRTAGPSDKRFSGRTVYTPDLAQDADRDGFNCGGKVKKYAQGGPVKRARSVPVAPPQPLMGPLESAMSHGYGNNMKRRMPRA